MRQRTTRGQFLLGGMAAGALAFPQTGRAAEPTAAERAALDLVTGFCASFATRDMNLIAPFLSTNCVYRITESSPPLTGPAALMQIRNYVERSTSVEFKILESWVKGSVVVNERIDHFVSPQREVSYHLTGVFYVKDGAIAEWTDYIIR